MSENIDVDSFVLDKILDIASLHALLVYEKGFDALSVRERIGDPFSLLFPFIRKVRQADCPQGVIGWLGRLNPVPDCLGDRLPIHMDTSLCALTRIALGMRSHQSVSDHDNAIGLGSHFFI